ncbi:MAG: RNA methyltransferase [Provencibacterium sp.]|jgi:tRNA G18 (ribose-2'-O)-methylase SpoU|nr:RNA methyltransferase [Provencibacterium sp.]
MKKIYSKNADYQKLEVLKTNRNKRYKYGEFLVEGVRNINEAIRNGWRFSSLIYSEELGLSEWGKKIIKTVQTRENLILTGELMRQLSGKEETSELLAVMQMRKDSPDTLHLPENPLIVLFDRPSNKGNLGTLIRSCDALGASALLITGHAVDLYDPAVVTAGMGSFFSLPVLRLSGNGQIEAFLSGMQQRYPGFRAVATTAHRQTPLYKERLDGPCILFIGNETDGLCQRLYELADTLVSIPMAQGCSASSLNVSCAATVLLYEIMRQRSEK